MIITGMAPASSTAHRAMRLLVIVLIRRLHIQWRAHICRLVIETRRIVWREWTIIVGVVVVPHWSVLTKFLVWNGGYCCCCCCWCSGACCGLERVRTRHICRWTVVIIVCPLMDICTNGGLLLSIWINVWAWGRRSARIPCSKSRVMW